MLSLDFMIVTLRTSLNSLHNLYIIIHALSFPLLELVFHITLCVVVLCVKCCTTMGSAATLVY